MRRNHLKGHEGDRINAVLAAAGYNFSLLLRWSRHLLRTLLLIVARAVLGLGDPLRLKSRASFNAIPILLLSQKRMQARQAKRDHSNRFVKKKGCKEKNK
jgi:hypothetical protein